MPTGEHDVAAAHGGNSEPGCLGSAGWEERGLHLAREVLQETGNARRRQKASLTARGDGETTYVRVALDVANERVVLVVHAGVGVHGHGALRVAGHKIRVLHEAGRGGGAGQCGLQACGEAACAVRERHGGRRRAGRVRRGRRGAGASLPWLVLAEEAVPLGAWEGLMRNSFLVAVFSVTRN